MAHAVRVVNGIGLKRMLGLLCLLLFHPVKLIFSIHAEINMSVVYNNSLTFAFDSPPLIYFLFDCFRQVKYIFFNSPWKFIHRQISYICETIRPKFEYVFQIFHAIKKTNYTARC